MIYSIQNISDRQIEELKQCPGVKIDINNRVAEVPFIAEGLFSTIANNKEAIKELKQIRKTYKIYSKILDDYLWIVANGKELQELVTEGVKDVIYTQEEVSRMIDECVSKEGLKVIHKVKKSFTGATVENIENEQDKI